VSGDSVLVGKYEIALATAVEWVAAYTDAEANRVAANPYAYPAYDCFNGDAKAAHLLLDGDLLAPGLLNVPVSIRSFYGLQRVRDHLQSSLASDDLARPIADLSDAQIAELVGPFYAVLDDSATKPWGVNATILSKVIHRKRPQSLALHDRWVNACYVGDGGPVPRAKAEARSWREYMILVSQAMAADLRGQRDQYVELQLASRADPPLTDLRLPDILAWNAGKTSS